MDATKRPSGDVELILSRDEAVVLLDLLSRWEQDGTQDSLPFADQAEQRVLWDLAASMERVVDALFSGDFAQVLAQSRAAVRDVE